MDFMAIPFAMIGLAIPSWWSPHDRIVAGLCLLYPRSGAVGAVLLATVMIGTMGASLGHRDQPSRRCAAVRLAGRPHRGRQGSGMVKSVIIKKSQGWDI